MDKADNIIERLAVHWNPRVSLDHHAFDHLGKRRFGIERNDVYAGHHYVSRRLVMDFEDIANQQPLMATQRVSIVGVRFLDHLIDGFAQALAVARAPDQAEKVAQTREGPIASGLAATTGRLGVAHR